MDFEGQTMELAGENWRMIDQHQRQKICGPKPQNTQQILRSKFELFFGAKFFGKFLGEIDGI
jgi:hypothetical protein